MIYARFACTGKNLMQEAITALIQEEIQYLMSQELNLYIHSYLETHDISSLKIIIHIQSKFISFGFSTVLLSSKYFYSVEGFSLFYSSSGTAKMKESSYNCPFSKVTLQYKIAPATNPATIPIAWETNVAAI